MRRATAWLAFVMGIVVVGCGDDAAVTPPDGGDGDGALDSDGHDGDAALDQADLPDVPVDTCPGLRPDTPPPTPDMDLGSALGFSVAMGSTMDATRDWSPSCTDSSSRDTAFAWTAPETRRYVFDLDGSDYNTVLGVFQPGGECGGTELVCNDDSGFGMVSAVALELTAGAALIIVVDGSGGAVGNFVLNILTASRTETGASCDNMRDDDRDGFVDCADGDCRSAALCTETDAECRDDVDNDADGLIDCMDVNCQADDVCAETGPECNDTADNDRDEAADCTDFDCRREEPCAEVPAQCGDGLDNDSDGSSDCTDPDCFAIGSCDSCPDADLGTATGPAVATGTTTGRPNRRTGTCTGSRAGDYGARFRAATTGTYSFDTVGSMFDTVLYVRARDCDGPELGCRDDGPGIGLASSVTVALVADQEVIVFIDGDSTGMFTLNVTFMAATVSTPNTTGQLVISEIMADPAGGDGGREWFEIYNPGSMPLNLRDCRLRDLGSELHVIGADVVVQAGTYATLASGLAPGFGANYVYADFTLGRADTIILECGGTEIDRVVYDGGGVFVDPTGRSLSLDSDVLDAVGNDDGANWCPANNFPGRYDSSSYGTPGSSSPQC